MREKFKHVFLDVPQPKIKNKTIYIYKEKNFIDNTNKGLKNTHSQI